MSFSIGPGSSARLGATLTENGVNFAVFSDHATQIFVCLFDADGRETKIALPEREGGIFHGEIRGLKAGQLYGLRARGPYRPDEGHRFNVNKLLIDPYARQLTGRPKWDDRIFGYDREAAALDLSFDPRDSASSMPRCIVMEDFDFPPVKRPGTPISDTVIYEGHVRGLTQLHPDIQQKGTFDGLAEPAMLEHLTNLGVTAIELLPVHAFLSEHFLVKQGLTNYWGYQSFGFFAPDPKYLGSGGVAGFRAMVDRFHEAGIEVFLDVVYNHTPEGDEMGPTISFRGLDNASYYLLADDRRQYLNYAGTGNTVNVDHPMVLRMVMDSLRYWVNVMGVDGFRFDLASVLGRTPEGFDRGSGFFDVIRQDPSMAGIKLIAEPWDIGPGGYQLGAYPPPFLEWNDKYRDGVRRFWRGDPGRVADLGERLTGSSKQFDHSRRNATASVNFLTAHDGMPLEDLVSYSTKHNEANGEGGKDGHSEDYSANLGVEGPTEDVSILAARARRKRAMMATLLMSQGTPMLLAGDELGNTQGGNNNAYAQDNETAWIDWLKPDQGFLDFTRRLIAFRRAHPVLRQKLFLHSRERMIDGVEDLFWWREDGAPMETKDWHDPARRVLAVEKRTAAGTPAYAASEYAVLTIFNAGPEVSFQLPSVADGQHWRHDVDSANPDHDRRVVTVETIEIAEQSVSALVLVSAEV
ncbi:glycogen debranching protein GlgX [Boseongicola aestuarii]|uniref:Glycogen debranching enzyme n=1 Tax=Boseongicola aestuarii TaxID=1470561 RepID=A0A238IXU7_9RHOB|nr:glycogen debranching protein GlgX [Boseongicola aestuarii]SMX23237.1 Glycogen debranching enzyme [Boseongicola aestuarii]